MGDMSAKYLYSDKSSFNLSKYHSHSIPYVFKRNSCYFLVINFRDFIISNLFYQSQIYYSFIHSMLYLPVTLMTLHIFLLASKEPFS